MKIGWQLTEKSAKNMRSWLITFNVTLGIYYKSKSTQYTTRLYSIDYGLQYSVVGLQGSGCRWTLSLPLDDWWRLKFVTHTVTVVFQRTVQFIMGIVPYHPMQGKLLLYPLIWHTQSLRDSQKNVIRSNPWNLDLVISRKYVLTAEFLHG